MRKTPIFLLLMIVGSIGLLTGCSEDSEDVTTASLAGSDDYEQLDFSQTYGGLSATDEEEAFDDSALKAMLLAEQDEEANDPLAADPEVLRLEAEGDREFRGEDRNRPRFTYLRLRWGMLRSEMDSVKIDSDCDMTDWTGTIRLDRGILVVKRKLAFERATDHIIWPRLDRQTVALVSKTWCYNDGLLLQLIERPANSDSVGTVDPNMIHIDLGPYSASFSVAELKDMDEVFDVGADGTKIQVTGFTLSDIARCPKGFISGIYRHFPQVDPAVSLADSTGNEDHGQRLGRFAGLWRGLDGRILGCMRGGYGITADGNRVFVGKIIDRRGHFRGLMRGGWEPGDREGDLASFKGHWVTRSGEMEGVLGGEGHPVEDYPGGFYVGRWTTLCDDEAEETVW